MDFLLMIVFGAIAGFIASYIMGGSNGLLMNIALGVVGAMIGGFFMNLFDQTGTTGFNIYSLLVSVLGAIIVIAIARMFAHRQVV